MSKQSSKAKQSSKMQVQVSKEVVAAMYSDDLQSQIRLSYDSCFSPLKKKISNQLFITQRKGSQVEMAYRQLNDYIDILDSRVTKFIQKHEAQFLVAYRNHVKRVRQEMQELRNKTLTNAKSSLSQTQQIDGLEKKLIIFREESLKMFDKVTEKQKIIYELQQRIHELQVQNKHQLQSLKNVTKRNKYLEGLRNQNLINEQTKEFHVSKPVSKLQTSGIDVRYSINTRPYTSSTKVKDNFAKTRSQSIYYHRNVQSQSSKYIQTDFQSLKFKIDQILEDTNIIIKDKVKRQVQLFISHLNHKNKEEPQSRNIQGKRKLYRKSLTEDKSFINSKKNEMEDYFRKCIDTVRKQIQRRKGIKNINFFKQHGQIPLEEFKKLDFFRLLELLLSNEKVLKGMYESIFSETTYFS